MGDWLRQIWISFCRPLWGVNSSDLRQNWSRFRKLLHSFLRYRVSLFRKWGQFYRSTAGWLNPLYVWWFFFDPSFWYLKSNFLRWNSKFDGSIQLFGLWSPQMPPQPPHVAERFLRLSQRHKQNLRGFYQVGKSKGWVENSAKFGDMMIRSWCNADI